MSNTECHVPDTATTPLADHSDNSSHTNRNLNQKLNWLRAGVLGANDGIVSTAGVIIGMAGATHNVATIVAAGSAALVAGALSMAGGEYVSVSAQRDTEQAVLTKVRKRLRHDPADALASLTRDLEDMGMSTAVAHAAAEDLTNRDAVAAHSRLDYGVTPGDLTNPWLAAGSSLISFVSGAALPLLVTLMPLGGYRVLATIIAVALGLLVTGYVSARLGDAPSTRAVVRNVVMGLVTMVVTYLIGIVFHTTVL